MIRHHPPIDLLFDYATGVADEGAALVIAAHASLCTSCAELVSNLEAVGGEILDTIAPEAVGGDLFHRLMERLDDEAVPENWQAIADAETRNVIPYPLLPYLSTGLDKVRWQSVGRLYQEFRLPLANKAVKTSLMRLPRGRVMPRHTHGGNEYAVVLDGGYRDGDKRYLRGDFSCKTTKDVHQPIVDDDGDCVCLVVLEAPLKLTGVVGRLINLFLRT